MNRAGSPAWILASGHSQCCSKLRTCWHGDLIEATAATLGCVRLPRFSSATDGVRSFRRSEGPCYRPCTTLKKTLCGCCGRAHKGWYDRRVRRVRDLGCGDARIYLEFEVRRVQCKSCGKVKREQLEFLADNPFYTQRFAHYVGRRCRSATIKDIVQELNPRLKILTCILPAL